MAKKTIRPVGDIMLDMEKLLFELHVDHDMQHGEVIYLISGWQHIHVPGQREQYICGGHPVLYGPEIHKNTKDALINKILKGIKIRRVSELRMKAGELPLYWNLNDHDSHYDHYVAGIKDGVVEGYEMALKDVNKSAKKLRTKE